jgi:hypothetical protein
VAGDYFGVVVQAEQAVFDRFDNCVAGAAPEVGSADAMAEERVAGEQEVSVVNQAEACAAGSVSGGVNDFGFYFA